MRQFPIAAGAVFAPLLAVVAHPLACPIQTPYVVFSYIKVLYRVARMFSLVGFSYITVLYRVFRMFGLLGFSHIMVLLRVFLDLVQL
jgi:hypothetical protein